MKATEFLLARISEDEAVAQEWPDDLAPPPGGGLWIDTSGRYIYAPRARVLADVEAKRAIVALEAAPDLGEWEPDVGGDWVLSGPGYFANYWPDNTVSVSIIDGDDERVATSGITPHRSRSECQAWAERWLVEHWQTPILRALTSVYADHPDFDEEWRS